MNFKKMSDQNIIREIGARLRRIRLNLNITQAQLADRCSLSQRVIVKAENGGTVTLATFIAMLRGLESLEQLDSFSRNLKSVQCNWPRLKGRQRQRASGKRLKEKPGKTLWTWSE